MAQRLLRGIANPVSRKRFPGSNPGPGVTLLCDNHGTEYIQVLYKLFLDNFP